MTSTHDDECAICPICGQQYGEALANPPPACKICEDDRQWTPGTGQEWTSLGEMKQTHRNEITQLEAGVHAIQTTPKFGIGQRCILVQARGGNVLWDCVSLVNDETIAAVEALGGVAKIVVSHPHFLGACLFWSNALPTRPLIYLHAADRGWVTRLDTEGSSPRYVFWEGDELALGEGLRAVRLGGHFPGSAVLLLANSAEDGEAVAFTSDTILPVPHCKWVSFMFSFPNLLPLPPSEVQRIRDCVAAWPEAFARLYGPFPSSVIKGGAKGAVLESAQRYLDVLAGKYHGQQQA